MEIKNLLKQPEGRKLEFKETLPQSDQIAKTAIAFSNGQGGTLIIGVSDDHTIVGVEENALQQLEEIISNTIYDNCQPVIIPNISTVTLKNKLLLVIHFYPSNSKPHYLKKFGKREGTIVRVGSSNRVATLDIIEELERQKRNIHFDSVVNYDLEYTQGCFDSLTDRLEKVVDTSNEQLLYEKLGLIKKERDTYFLTNTGILFHSQRKEFFPLVKIECARFKGTTTKVFIDQATYDGDIVESIEESLSFVKRNIKLGATIGEVYREDHWEYPLLALREIIINAVIHRDYSILGSDIKVAIFDDMIEITSPGVFLIDKEKLGQGYSELRNSTLGGLFKKLNIIEQWGTGFEKVVTELKEYPAISLEADDSSTFTQIRFIKNTPLNTPPEHKGESYINYARGTKGNS